MQKIFIAVLAAGVLITASALFAGCGGGNGNNSNGSSNVPFSQTSRIAVGHFHTCALTSSGGIKCWGDNSSGALGNGSGFSSKNPVDVSGLTSGTSAISAGGGDFTCALTSSGGVKCWGDNSSGSLGDGTTHQRTTPVDVSGLKSGVSAISVGGNTACALTFSGGVKCWGYKKSKYIDDAEIFEYRNEPENIEGLASGVTAVSAGGMHACALTSLGGIKCWGDNRSGQLGNGLLDFSLTPVDVPGFTSGVTAISAGGGHTCALTSSGGGQVLG